MDTWLYLLIYEGKRQKVIEFGAEIVYNKFNKRGENMNDNEEYKTSNFHIAVWLMMNGKPIKNINWLNKRRAEFVFDDFDDREEMVNKFFTQEQLQGYISNSQELKARMYASHSPEIYDNE